MYKIQTQFYYFYEFFNIIKCNVWNTGYFVYVIPDLLLHKIFVSNVKAKVLVLPCIQFFLVFFLASSLSSQLLFVKISWVRV